MMENLSCPECGIVFSKPNKGKCFKSLTNHLRNKHSLKLSPNEVISVYEIDISFLEEMRKDACDAAKRKWRSPEHIEKRNHELRLKLGDEKYNALPECKICGFRANQLYKHIFNIHEISVEEYRNIYSDSLVEIPEYIEYLIESKTGDRNPCWKNGSSENSPWSEEFYMKKGMSKEEAKQAKKEFIAGVVESKDASSYSTKVEYYMKKYGVSKLEAMDMLRERQRTNTLENIAKRNDIKIDDAQVIRDDITKKWIDTMESKTDSELIEISRKKTTSSRGVSKASTKFFNLLLEELSSISINEVDMGDHEFGIVYIDDRASDLEYKKKSFLYDFRYKNKIIEYNGTVYHADPDVYGENDRPYKNFKSSNLQNLTAKEIWECDERKQNMVRQLGYDVLVIWENEAKKSVKDSIMKCIDFLTDAINEPFNSELITRIVFNDLEIPRIDAVVSDNVDEQFKLEFVDKKGRNRHYNYSFKFGKKLIEFYDDIEQANPVLFKNPDLIHKSGVPVNQLWKLQDQKQRCATYSGYDLLTVWKSEWKNDRNSVISKIKSYLCNQL